MTELNQGKIPENVLKRSILKPISHRRIEALLGAKAGGDAAILKTDGLTVVSSASASLGIRHAVYSAANNIGAKGGDAVGLMVFATLPEGTEEPVLKETEAETERYCQELSLEIIGGHTEISPAVTKPLISVTAIGKASEASVNGLSGAEAGDSLILAGHIALEGTAMIASEREAEVLAKFPAEMVRKAQDFGNRLSVRKASDTAFRAGASAMHDLSTGGVFAGLWEIADFAGLGLMADMRKLPVRQESIEICNVFDINPYGLLSGGGLLIAAKDPEAMLAALEREGINAAIVGSFTDSNDRVLINGDTKRFLEFPKTDEIYGLIK